MCKQENRICKYEFLIYFINLPHCDNVVESSSLAEVVSASAMTAKSRLNRVTGARAPQVSAAAGPI